MSRYILNEVEVNVLRELARQYADIASLPQQKQTKELWNQLNQGNMQRPMVVVDQLPWNELNIENAMDCVIADPYWHSVEWEMRSVLLRWKYFPVDMVVNPYVKLPRVFIAIGYGISADVHTSVTDEKNSVVGQIFTSQITCMEDIQKIKTPHAEIDHDAENIVKEQAAHIFAGIIPVKMGGINMHVGIWDPISQWMGIEDCYYNIVDEPELIHAVMDHTTNATLDYIDNLNEIKAFDMYDNQCHCSYTFNDNDPRNINEATSYNSWAFGLAQLFSSVSPKVTEEFEVPYMQRIFPKFANIYYGCCDRLDDRLDIVMQMPNIRKISCSPWSDRDNFAANLPKNIIMSNKPSPAFLVPQPISYENIVNDIKHTMSAAKTNGVGLELILKDVSTIMYEPERLINWCKLAMETVNNW